MNLSNLFNVKLTKALSHLKFTNSQKLTAALGTAALGAGVLYYYMNDYERREDLSKNNFDVTKLPDKFSFGAATSEIQYSGVTTTDGNTIENNWTAWENQHNLPKIDNANDHWTQYEKDYLLAKEFGLNNLRISFEWSKYQPDNEYECNDEVIEHFLNRIRTAQKVGIKLALCCYHHSLPNWFVDKGGFEKAENIDYFVRYAVTLFQRIKDAGLLDSISFCLTFNEPAGYALAAYVHGKYPPGLKFKGTNFNTTLKLCGIVLKNMLDAHVEIYKKLKAIAPDLPISIAHMMQPIQPYNPWNPLDLLPAKLFNHLLNNVTLEYFSTGRFKWLWSIDETNEDAKNTLDFIGVNYYTHTLLRMFKDTKRPSEITADADEGEQGKAIYAEGFYDSLKTVHKYLPTLPIYITELGFASEDCDKQKEFINRHFYVIQKALKEGMKITGCDWWTLLDYYGWNSGNGSRYGLYHVDFSKADKPRSLKESSGYLKGLIQTYKDIHQYV